MGMEIPQGDINTNLITSTITSILTHTQHHNKSEWERQQVGERDHTSAKEIRTSERERLSESSER